MITGFHVINGVFLTLADFKKYFESEYDYNDGSVGIDDMNESFDVFCVPHDVTDGVIVGKIISTVEFVTDESDLVDFASEESELEKIQDFKKYKISRNTTLHRSNAF